MASGPTMWWSWPGARASGCCPSRRTCPNRWCRWAANRSSNGYCCGFGTTASGNSASQSITWATLSRTTLATAAASTAASAISAKRNSWARPAPCPCCRRARHTRWWSPMATSCRASISAIWWTFMPPAGAAPRDAPPPPAAEKPVHDHLISAGIYVLSPQVLPRIPQGQALDMPELLLSLIDEHHKIGVFVLEDEWVDVGRHDDLERVRRSFTDQG